MIQIHLKEGTPFVWNAEDAREIREQHRLTGCLVGALARQPQQNMRLGLPLQLLPEEARLLLEIKAAVLVRSMPGGEQDVGNKEMESYSSDSDEDGCEKEKRGKEEKILRPEVEAYQNELDESYKEQRRLAIENKKEFLQSHVMHMPTGKKKSKRRKQSENVSICTSEQPSSEANTSILQELENLESRFNFPQDTMMVQIPTARRGAGKLETVDWNIPSDHWPYPGQQNHETRYRVLRDLWNKGYYISAGNKFGGDFLVYPGDPLRFHAHYIAVCCPYKKRIPVYSLIAMGRLGTNVKKTLLLCSVDSNGDVTYTSLQWTGFQ
ncbi:tRNA-splicing endonuclease subunit Sen34 isoform X2 [Protopterus annectens]|nr:tRNA-splicing endonuclease subunit Sen34 isoform X2 [Protopterus annectens]XP_043937584.1 tRNA-splicing endonuclease subunit Sen34 isoform X2 [Protopterus annectens]